MSSKHLKATLLVAVIGLAPGCSTTSQAETGQILITGKATKYENTFSMGYQVVANIKAPPAKVWTILTSAADYPSWNTTVISITGKIGRDEDLVLKAKIAPDRDFELHVSEFVPVEKMVWEDGTAGIFKGVRTYVLTPQVDGSTNFAMSEDFAGAMLPMIKGSLPDFRASFEDFAADLKRHSETK